MRHVHLSLTSSDGGLARLSAVEEMSMAESFVGANVGKSIVSSSAVITGVAVTGIELGIKEVGLPVPSPDRVGEEVEGDDFVMHSSLLT